MPTREGSPTIGTAELFENERVKIWDFVLEPGEALPMHTHRRDHVIVVIEGGDLEVEYGDGRRQAYSPRPGDVHFGQRRRGGCRYARCAQRRHDALPEPDHRAEGPAAGVTRLTIVSLNTAHRDEVFAPVRAIDGVELVHADYRVSWEEISARRAGRSLPDPEPLPAELAATLARADVVFGFVIPRDILALAPRLQVDRHPGDRRRSPARHRRARGGRSRSPRSAASSVRSSPSTSSRSCSRSRSGCRTSRTSNARRRGRCRA